MGEKQHTLLSRKKAVHEPACKPVLKESACVDADAQIAQRHHLPCAYFAGFA